MGWNDSNDKQNPWNKNNNAPPDIDEALKKLLQKLKSSFQGKNTSMPSSKNPMSHAFGWFMGTLVLLWGLAGIFIVDPAEQAVIQRFGRYVDTLGPGPHWIPRFFESKVIKNVERVSDYSYSAQMLTKDENLVSVSIAVQYRIKDLQNYLFNVTDPEESLRQATSSALRQVVGNTTLDQIITEGREAWGASVKENLIGILKQYQTGIEIVNVSPQPARAPENVQEAFDDAIKAQEDEKRFKEQALAYEANVVPIAEGNAEKIIQEAEAFSKQQVLKAKGEVSEFLSLLPEYLRAPQVTGERLYLETFQNVLSKSSKIIIDTKSNPMIYLPLDRIQHATTLQTPPMTQAAPTDGNSTNMASSNTAAAPAVPLRIEERSSVRDVNREE